MNTLRKTNASNHHKSATDHNYNSDTSFIPISAPTYRNVSSDSSYSTHFSKESEDLELKKFKPSTKDQHRRCLLHPVTPETTIAGLSILYNINVSLWYYLL